MRECHWPVHVLTERLCRQLLSQVQFQCFLKNGFILFFNSFTFLINPGYLANRPLSLISEHYEYYFYEHLFPFDFIAVEYSDLLIFCPFLS